MTEILKMLNALTADELDSVLTSGAVILEKKRKEEAEAALREKERLRQEKIAQEKRRQDEIVELQRKLEELQKQQIVIPEDPAVASGSNFVMYDAPATGAQSTAPAAPQPAQTISCPHCQTKNAADSQFCSNCGQNMTLKRKEARKEAEKATVAQSAPSQATCPHCHHLNTMDSLFCAKCGQKMTQPQPPQNAPKPAPQPQPPQSAPKPQSNAAQVIHADASIKEWEMLPGETMERYKHVSKDVVFLQPNMGRKYVYSMQVTNRRILFWRQSALARNMTTAFIGVGGRMLAQAAGGYGEPYLAIPFAAIKSCGLQNKNEFFIEADQKYVLKNKGFEKFLPELVANATK